MSVAVRASTGRAHGVIRSTLAPIAWGASLVLAAMGASAIVAGASGALPFAVGALLVALGLAGLAWGAAVLARGRVVVPRLAIGAVLGAIVAVGADLAVTAGRASPIGAAVALSLLLATAAMVAAERRRPAPASASVRVVPLLLVAAIIAVVATPALGAVQSAALTRDDGTVIEFDPHQGH